MKLHVWSNLEGLHLSRPNQPATLQEVDFDPDVQCRQCGQHVLSISADHSHICPWCESGTNRPKILRYQELEIVRLLQQQSGRNKPPEPGKRALISNRATEKDLRDFLSEQGYYGRSARFLQLELAAIERPGWVQIFEFQVQAKQQNGEWEELFGVCRSDERHDLLEVQLFPDQETFRKVLRQETHEMLTAQREPKHWSFPFLMALFAAAVVLAIAGAMLTQQTSAN